MIFKRKKKVNSLLTFCQVIEKINHPCTCFFRIIEDHMGSSYTGKWHYFREQQAWRCSNFAPIASKNDKIIGIMDIFPSYWSPLDCFTFSNFEIFYERVL